MYKAILLGAISLVLSFFVATAYAQTTTGEDRQDIKNNQTSPMPQGGGPEGSTTTPTPQGGGPGDQIRDDRVPQGGGPRTGFGY